MELRIAQSLLRERIQRRHIDAPAEGARRTEADVIEQDYDNVWSTLGWPEWLDRRELCIARIQRSFAGIHVLRVWYRQLSAIDLLRGRGNHPRGDPQGQCNSKNQNQFRYL